MGTTTTTTDDEDTQGSTTQLPSITFPQGSTDPYGLTRLIAQIQAASQQGVQLPALQRAGASDGTRPGFLGLLGEALAGGQSPLYRLQGAQEDTAGSRALMNFGINMMLASGPHAVRTPLTSAFAEGLQGAQQSMDQSQQLAYTQAGQQFEQQSKLADLQIAQQNARIQQLQAILPLLRLQGMAGTASPYGGTASTATATPPGTPSNYSALIAQAAQKYGLPVDVVTKMFSLESGFNPNAVNKDSGATGMGQVLPSTAVKPGYGLTPLAGNTADAQKALLDPATNIDFSAKYLAARAKDLYGDKLDWTNPDQVKGALNAYGGAPTGGHYADAVMAQPVGAAPPVLPPSGRPVTVATNVATAAAPGATTTTVAPAPGTPGSAAVDQASAQAKATKRPVIMPISGGGGIIFTPEGGVVDAANAPAALRASAAPLAGAPAATAPAPTQAPATAPRPALPPSPTQAPPVAAPPPAPTTAPSTTQPAPTTPPTPPIQPGPDVPDTALTLEQYTARHWTPLTPEQIKSYTVGDPDNPENKALADQADIVQKAQAQADAARASYNTAFKAAQSGMTGFGDLNKAMAQVKDAEQAEADAKEKYNTLVQTGQSATATNMREADTAQATRLAAAYKDVQDRQQQTALKTQEGQQQIQLAQAQAGYTWHQKLEEQAAEYAQTNTLKPMAEQAIKAHQLNLGLAQLQTVLPNLPPGGGVVGAILDARPDLAPLLNVAGVLTNKQADAVQLLRGITSTMSTEMKPTGLGSMREYEFDAFRASLPDLLKQPDGQQKAIAYLMNLNNRIIDENSFMSNYFSRPVPDTMSTKPGATRPAHNLEPGEGGKSVQQMMDEKLGPIVPTYQGPPNDAAVNAWIQSLPPGKPYYRPYAARDPNNPSKPLLDANGRPVTRLQMDVRPWQQ